MGRSDKQLYLYDPRTNILSETNYNQIEAITGISKTSLASMKSRKIKIGRINCYLTDETVTLQQRREWYEKEKNEMETWKTVIGSDGKYLISNFGRFKRVYKNHTGLLLPYLNKRKGYLEIKVRFNNKYENCRVGYLVAVHFVGTPKPGHVVRHKNGIKTDDFAGNLELITNQELGKKTGYKSKSKEVIQFDRFTGEILGEFRSAREAGRQCFLSYQSVIDCCNGKYKSSGGIYVFKWADELEELNDGA